MNLYRGGGGNATRTLTDPHGLPRNHPAAARSVSVRARPCSSVCPRFGGPVGAGYGHRLAWTYIFRRPPEDEAWEVIVDAHSGEVLAFQDVNHYIQQQITGGVYPLTNTEICPNAQICGTLQSGWPMPFADTGLASPTAT